MTKLSSMGRNPSINCIGESNLYLLGRFRLILDHALETMNLSTYGLYLAALALLVLTPGPTMLMSMTNAIAHGAPKAMASASGSITAALGMILLSSLGMGAVLAASDNAFLVLKLFGGAYLIYLGIKTMRSPTSSFDLPCASTKAELGAPKLYLQGFLVGASNPKALLFFAAFFPQFVDPNRSWAMQFAILALTFVVFEFATLSVATVFAARIAPWLRQAGRARIFNQVSGSLFAGMGCLLLAARK
jgi:threonine/homoserine/homoserine lactone efflux protein